MAGPHPRKAIRDALIARLTGLPTTGASVHPDPVYELDPASLPALMLRTGDEQVEIIGDGLGRRTMERLLSMDIAIIARGTGRSDVLDQAAAEIEDAIAQDETLGGAAHDCRLAALRRRDETGDAPHAELALEYQILYTTEV